MATIRFEVFENFEAWGRQYEGWQIDEFVIVPFVLAFVFGVYYWRQVEGA